MGVLGRRTESAPRPDGLADRVLWMLGLTALLGGGLVFWLHRERERKIVETNAVLTPTVAESLLLGEEATSARIEKEKAKAE